MDVTSFAEQLLFTTVRIETRRDDGRVGCGTGFIFSIPAGEENREFHALVTNKHVVEACDFGRFALTQADGDKPKLGSTQGFDIPNLESKFVGHPDPSVDVTACAFGPIVELMRKAKGVSPFYRSVPSSLIPNPEQLADLDAIEEVVFVGYPNSIFDAVNNLPIIRRGTTATPVEIDFLGRPQFLIDASVFPGSSGSPVFLYNRGSYSMKGGGTVIGNRAFFLGLISSVYFRREQGKIELRPIPSSLEPVTHTREMVDLGLVFKARVVLETVENALAQLKSRIAMIQP